MNISDSNKCESISSDLKLNIDRLKEIFSDCSDMIYRKISLKDKTEGYLFYVKGLVQEDVAQRNFVMPIMNMKFSDFSEESTICKIPTINLNIYKDIKVTTEAILSGKTIIIINGLNYAIGSELLQFEKRSITEPEVEKDLRAPHEGFVEVLDTNISILRRRIKSSKLKFKTFMVGSSTNQKVVLGYIEGIANPEIFKALYEKLNGIDYDGLIAVGYIQQLITDFPNSIFPQYRLTERPDIAEKALLDGKFAIMVDGTPGALLAPETFMSFFKTTDDYSSNWIAGTSIRLLRIAGTLISIMLPAYYIALTMFHYYMVPFSLVIPLANSRAKVPFSPIVEGIIMEFIIEALREAAVRLPTYISASIGVVGGIILGQAVVEAGIVSNLFIIIVAVTAITSYMIPTYDIEFSVRISRIIFMFAAAAFGILGIIVFNSLLIAHLVTIESLGQPYLQPLSPTKYRDFKDSIVRLPLSLLKKRSDEAKPRDTIRGKNNE